jgi:dGTPase
MNLNAISIENTVLREKSLSVYACPTVKATRLREENREHEFNVRPDFFRDADRILHSMAYTRYMDKTQVFPMVSNDLITHRGLHVQFVAKIARTIGRVLSLNEDLIEAIGLGHDLGHVPFGHFGERVLNKICEENDLGLFLHNAQSVRVLQTLENNGQGLNITVQVLDGILCHNGEILEKRYEPDYKKTISQFLEEYEKCWEIEGYDKRIRAMTLEGCVVRISDVIAYIGRDIEDAIVLGIIKREDIPESITKVLGNTNSKIIDSLVKDLIEHSYGKPYLEFSDMVFTALKELMDFNYQKIYNNPIKSDTEERSIKLFRMLYEKYLEDLQNERGFIYEEYYKKMSQAYTEGNSYGKIVVDFIAGMTDNFFIEQFEDNFLPVSK